MPNNTGEHLTTIDYVRQVGGRAYFEFRVSGATVDPESRIRRIDAVRIDGIADGECIDYNADRFGTDLRAAIERDLEVGLIEAKNRASRYTIGRAIAAGDLFLETFPDAGRIVLAVLYDERRADAALDCVSLGRGIRVHRRSWVRGE